MKVIVRALRCSTVAMMISLLAAAGPAGPILEPIAEIKQETRTEIKFQARAKVDTPSLRFGLSKLRKDGKDVMLPVNMKLDADKGAFAWTPSPSQAGTYDMTLDVTDAKDRQASTVVRITVKERAVTTTPGQLGELLRQWHAEGTAAGNTGDFYDNRDRDHSPLSLDPYPQLDMVTYTDQERKLRVDWAAQRKVLDHVTFGNSSTSAPVLFGGSNVRSYYASPRGMPLLYEQYRKNNLYIYPAHHDHHPGRNGKPFYGDVYPCNSPYLITSQGSSGSDQPFMRAIPYTLAAFRPEVKKKLIEAGLLMPTLQMILRSSNKHLTKADDYLTGKAHPPVFEGSWVDDLKMVQAAHAIEITNAPPLIQLKVLEEETPVEGKDYFDPGVTENLHDTPAALSRLFRGGNYTRRLVVSAEESFDVNKRPLTFHWVVLRGDAEHIRIKRNNNTGSVVELEVSYQERQPGANAPIKIDSNRIDIGAFVHNGAYYSAPGFITFFSFDSEARTYDDKGKLLEIGYGVGDADFGIDDWNALFEALKNEGGGVKSKLLRQRLKPEQLAGIGKLAEEYKTAWSQHLAAQENHKTAQEVRQKAEAVWKQAEGQLKVAQKALTDKPSDETKAALEKATAERDAAQQSFKKAEGSQQAVQKAADAAAHAVNEIMTQKKPGFDVPVKDLIEQILNRHKDNPRFLFEQRRGIEELLRSADDGQTKRFQEGRMRLVNLGILKTGDAFALDSIRPGPGPAAERLTRYERNQLERFHGELIAGLIYPKVITYSFKENFVDQRLSAHKAWRDVYHYDDKGNGLGWTRLDGTTTQQFTSDGLLVLEKDDKERPAKARTVNYVADEPSRRTFARSVKQLPGNKIEHYAYDADGKRRLVKREELDK